MANIVKVEINLQTREFSSILEMVFVTRSTLMALMAKKLNFHGEMKETVIRKVSDLVTMLLDANEI